MSINDINFKLTKNIKNFTDKITHKHHRYQSWEICYEYFQKNVINNPNYDKNYAALMLGFYLASWGMYRGSSKLLTEYTYTIHKGAIDIIRNNQDNLYDCYKALVNYYKLDKNTTKNNKTIKSKNKNTKNNKGVSTTSTLISKIILGTLGAMPAYDKFLQDGIKCFNCKFKCKIKQSINFNDANKFKIDRNRIINYFKKYVLDKQNIEYNIIEDKIIIKDKINKYKYKINEWPLAKFIDVYFWQLGQQVKDTKWKPPKKNKKKK